MSKKKDRAAAGPEADARAEAAAPEAHPPEDVAPAGGGNGEAREARGPSHTIRLGRVKVTIWTNYTREGRPFFSAVPSRVYRTGDGDWAQSTSFDRMDLLALAEACRLASVWQFANPLPDVDDDVPF